MHGMDLIHWLLTAAFLLLVVSIPKGKMFTPAGVIITAIAFVLGFIGLYPPIHFWFYGS